MRSAPDVDSNDVLLLRPAAKQDRRRQPCPWLLGRQGRQVGARRAAYALAVERGRVAELAELCRVAVERKTDGPVGHEPQLAA